MLEDMFLEKDLNVFFRGDTKKGHTLDYLQDVESVSRYCQCQEADKIANKLEHVIERPNSVHACLHEKHETKWDDQRDEERALGRCSYRQYLLVLF